LLHRTSLKPGLHREQSFAKREVVAQTTCFDLLFLGIFLPLAPSLPRERRLSSTVLLYANVKWENTVFTNIVFSRKHPYFDFFKVYYIDDYIFDSVLLSHTTGLSVPSKLLYSLAFIPICHSVGQVQSTAHQTTHFGFCTALISRAFRLISNCNCITLRAVDRTSLQRLIRARSRQSSR
jgi:hypothetical protein